MTEHAHAAPHAHGHHPNYVRVWAVLVVLLVVSVVGPMFGIRAVTLLTAFGIAFVKAYLVAKNFMHLNVQRPVVHWALGFSILFMVLLYAGVAPDVQKSDGQHWRKSAGYHYVSDAARGHHPSGAARGAHAGQPAGGGGDGHGAVAR